jgi:hypothetical protein
MGQEGVEKQRRKVLMKNARQSSPNPDLAEEHALFESLLDNYSSSKFPFAVAAEWNLHPPTNHEGRGDLVFASKNVQYKIQHEPCQVLVVEVKHMNKGNGTNAKHNRTHARGLVEDQLRKSMRAWSAAHPKDEVSGAIFSNEAHRPMGNTKTDAKIGDGYLSMLL